MSGKRGKACVCGHFGFGEMLLNGQTVKTVIVAKELERHYGADAIYKQDTHGGIKKLLTLPFALFGSLRKNENIVILPAHNGLRVIAPVLAFENRFFGRRLHYVVIGGWLPVFLKKRPRLIKTLKTFDGIYVETNVMKREMEAMGFDNVVVMPNCKDLKILTQEELVYPASEPYALCTFSRVMKEKGIEEAVQAVKAVNERYGHTVFSLDIYGQVDASQTTWFQELSENFPAYVRYQGSVPYDQSVTVLKQYAALLFPTRFYTEGVPGTIIDAYAAGVPVIASKWESFEDVASEDTAFGYEFDDVKALLRVLEAIVATPESLTQKKTACLRRAQDFLPQKAMQVLKERLM